MLPLHPQQNKLCIDEEDRAMMDKQQYCQKRSPPIKALIQRIKEGRNHVYYWMTNGYGGSGYVTRYLNDNNRLQ